MLSIRRASEADCALIRRLAGEVFPATYREILAPAQLDYMMEWMYSEESLQGQFRAGHVWFIASSDGEPCGYVSVERQGGARCIFTNGWACAACARAISRSATVII